VPSFGADAQPPLPRWERDPEKVLAAGGSRAVEDRPSAGERRDACLRHEEIIACDLRALRAISGERLHAQTRVAGEIERLAIRRRAGRHRRTVGGVAERRFAVCGLEANACCFRKHARPGRNVGTRIVAAFNS
jgi:hypothetical protein